MTRQKRTHERPVSLACVVSRQPCRKLPPCFWPATATSSPPMLAEVARLKRFPALLFLRVRPNDSVYLS